MIELPPALTKKLRAFVDRVREEYQRELQSSYSKMEAADTKLASTLSWLIKRNIQETSRNQHDCAPIPARYGRPRHF